MRYEIKQYEIHICRNVVEADSQSEAIIKLFAGDVEQAEQDKNPMYWSTPEDIGLSIEASDLTDDDLEKLNAEKLIHDDFVPTIHSIAEIS